MSEHDERIARGERGPSGETGHAGERGDTGKTGPRGVRGLPPGLLSSFVILAVIILALVLGGYLVLLHDANRITTTEQAITRDARANARQRCASIAQIVHIPIPVPTHDNPSRVTWAQYSQIERHRGTELGCKLPAARYAQAKP